MLGGFTGNILKFIGSFRQALLLLGAVIVY